MPKTVQIMANIEIFKNDLFGSVRVTVKESQPLFCLTDVCKALDLGNPSQVKTRLDGGVISNEVIPDSIGRQQEMTFVNEDGLYDVILDSRKPEAKVFRKWVTSEVLPSIRKTGGYIAAKTEDTPEEIMARALLVAQDTLRRRDERIAQLQRENESHQEKIRADAPKVLFAEAVSTSQSSCLVGELAKIIQQNGVQIGQNRLFKWMRSNGFLCNYGAQYNMPTQKAMELGLFEIKEHSIMRPDGSVMVTRTTKVTGKGQVYFVNRFLKRA